MIRLADVPARIVLRLVPATGQIFLGGHYTITRDPTAVDLASAPEALRLAMWRSIQACLDNKIVEVVDDASAPKS